MFYQCRFRITISFEQKIQPYSRDDPIGVRLFHLFTVGYSSCCPFGNFHFFIYLNFDDD